MASPASQAARQGGAPTPSLEPPERFPVILWTTDAALRFVSLGGAALHRVSRRGSDLIGAPVNELFCAGVSNGEPVAAHRRALSGRASRFEFDLGELTMHANVEPLVSADGQITGVVGASIDITERSASERALRISERSYRSLIEEAPYAICRVTPGGQLLQVNRAMLQMLAYESEGDLLLARMGLDIFAASDDYGRFLAGFGGPVANYGFETAWQTANGQRMDVSLGGRAIRDNDGRISFFEIVAEDIGARKQLQDQLRQAQKMQAVGQLAGGVAHDFNNLLTVMKGHLEMALTELPGVSRLRSRLEEVERAADRASALTRQLLAFGRIQPVQAKALDLNAAVEGAMQLLTRLIGEKITLCFLPAEHLHNVVADPNQLEQVLMNLAVNARDAMPEGGLLTITTCNTRLSPRTHPELQLTDESDFVSFTVSDTGHGMSAEVQSRIFEPFYTTKTLGQGTGLGLFTVYGIVKQAGGYLRVRSEPGKGTDFTVHLPSSEASIQEVPSPASSAVRGGRETILIAEDEEAIRELFSDFLRKLGYTVLAAGNGIDAAGLAAGYSEKIDLLLTDVIMPHLGGRELADKLISLYPDLRVILMSGYAGDAATLTTAQRPFMVSLQKPFSAGDLAKKIREVMDDGSGL